MLLSFPFVASFSLEFHNFLSFINISFIWWESQFLIQKETYSFGEGFNIPLLLCTFYGDNVVLRKSYGTYICFKKQPPKCSIILMIVILELKLSITSDFPAYVDFVNYHIVKQVYDVCRLVIRWPWCCHMIAMGWLWDEYGITMNYRWVWNEIICVWDACMIVIKYMWNWYIYVWIECGMSILWE